MANIYLSASCSNERAKTSSYIYIGDSFVVSVLKDFFIGVGCKLQKSFYFRNHVDFGSDGTKARKFYNLRDLTVISKCFAETLCIISLPMK